LNHPTVFTYGSLRVGDAKFVALINSTVTLWKIVKQNDFMVRIPNCYFSPVAGVWRCFTAPVLKRFIIQPNFPLRVYYQRYVSLNRGPLGKLLAFRKGNHSPTRSLPARRNGHGSNHHQLRHQHQHQSANRRWISPTTVPRGSLSQVRTNMIKTYYKYIYYTQPIGREVFYNSAMTNYQNCAYLRGVSSCEKTLAMPTSFTSASHKVYYGINFDMCPI